MCIHLFNYGYSILYAHILSPLWGFGSSPAPVHGLLTRPRGIHGGSRRRRAVHGGFHGIQIVVFMYFMAVAVGTMFTMAYGVFVSILVYPMNLLIYCLNIILIQHLMPTLVVHLLSIPLIVTELCLKLLKVDIPFIGLKFRLLTLCLHHFDWYSTYKYRTSRVAIHSICD